ncbi:KRAB [Mytilus edulis]|uniref:KRAB n=1 Tax=Mytilus edulis TaxID=6550 RepID=A0A8S3QU72_MYTED|nr:KRAB [Mytilus edulis]
MTTNEQYQCHLCGKQVGSKSGLLGHMRKHNDGIFDCFCGKTFDSIKNLNQHKKCHNVITVKSCCEKEVSEESEESTDSDSDEMEDSTSESSSAMFNSKNNTEKQKDIVDLEENVLRRLEKEGSILPERIFLEEGDRDQLPCLQEQILIDECESYQISDKSLEIRAN